MVAAWTLTATAGKAEPRPSTGRGRQGGEARRLTCSTAGSTYLDRPSGRRPAVPRRAGARPLVEQDPRRTCRRRRGAPRPRSTPREAFQDHVGDLLAAPRRDVADGSTRRTEADCSSALFDDEGPVRRPQGPGREGAARRRAGRRSRRSGPSCDRLKKAAPPKYPVVHTLDRRAEPGRHDGPPPRQPRDARARRSPGGSSRSSAASSRAVHAGERPAGAGPRDRQPRQPADGPGDGQPGLAAPLRPGPGRHAEQLRQAGRAADATPSCSTTWPAGSSPSGWSIKALHREILLSATYQLAAAGRRRERRGRPRQHAALADEPPAAGGRGLARRDAGRLRQARPDGRRPVAGPRRRRTTAAGPSTPRSAGTTSTRLLRLFDFPDPNITSDRADRDHRAAPAALRPEQRVHGRAGQGAGRPADAPTRTTDAGRIRRAFLLLYGRPATDREVDDRPRVPRRPPSPATARGRPDAAGSSTPRCCWRRTSSCSSIDSTCEIDGRCAMRRPFGSPA